MGRHRIQYSKEAIEAILKDLDSGLKIAEAAKKYGVSVPTLYDWRRVAKHMSNIEAGIEEGDGKPDFSVVQSRRYVPAQFRFEIVYRRISCDPDGAHPSLRRSHAHFCLSK